MRLITLGSGSSGNSYILKANNDQTLIIEAGLPLKQILQGLDFNTSDVVGCCLSHFHNDHALSAKELEQRGVKIFTLPEVIETKNLTLATAIQHKHRYQIGSFRVTVLNMAHDVPCVGFLIEHPEMGKLLFCTDSYILPYKLSKLNHLLVECNYSDEALEWAISSGKTPSAMRERLLTSHMEIGTLKQWLSKNDLSEVREIVLIHLSGNNSNPDTFKSEIEKQTGKPTYIAKKGLELELSLEPY